MSVMKVVEIMASSEKSWEDAAQEAVKKASQSIEGIKSVYVKEQSAVVRDGEISEYRVNVKITFKVN